MLLLSLNLCGQLSLGLGVSQSCALKKHITKHSCKLIKEGELKWLTKALSQVLPGVIPSPFLLPEDGGKMHFLPQPELKGCICFVSAKYFMEQLL